MSEPIYSLLTQLSEAGEGARLWGRAARPYYGSEFDRLLRRRVLTECVRAESWEVCSDCSCGIDSRPIRDVDGRLRAICPADHAADTPLEVNDLRTFRIDSGRLVAWLGEASGFSATEQVLPGLWHLGRLGSGRLIVVSLARGDLTRPELLSFLRSLVGGGPMTLLAPEPALGVRRRLLEAGIDLVELQAALVAGSRGTGILDLSALEPMQAAPRLLIERQARRATLDGRLLRLSDQQRSLLIFLAELARKSPEPVENRLLENHLWGGGVHRITSGVRDPIRVLRNALAANAADPSAARALVDNTRNGYRLNLEAEDISIVD